MLEGTGYRAESTGAKGRVNKGSRVWLCQKLLNNNVFSSQGELL